MKQVNVQDSWIPTYTGGRVSLTHPRTDQIRIEDVAAGLARVCRWSGQTPLHYSVAQHCVLCVEHLPTGTPRPVRLATLLHDASEA